ncbi:CDP-diacylglycerol--serine O-phosphatidyltransferase [Methanosarcinales archaeon ex4572_44]|nr:MAG: CDP-diacylglycerol--serine O-phosphatidyltransferase [Methanosarcinales archaeon ex4484_138]PHP45888.1 MAG: CDP-diacylglycerol--serine O-phosphatidyltransferase [Methanosarcinales archaeon ex4572_44]RLG27264.1 MAG: CDP-diacylglycerol--serine O-phosphatidyltransferase [Methanosarcinales archaeon]RLG27340.1 MAG: CDP-diacylglycerol--serine O-phosphatidyltransferase [Methanosarcinales archaeon]HHI30718.1 CDP-diacylglycerol--serine O-phosphatidyltransferase [Candidatus Methanoperedenaceae ar
MDQEHILYSIKKADLATLTNAAMGFAATICLIQHNFDCAAILIILAAIADGVDGAISRRCAYSPLGKHLDSLADAISFGMVPATATYLLITPRNIVLAFVLAILFLSCGLLRLARFTTRTEIMMDFQGIPITAAGLTIMLLIVQRETTELFPHILTAMIVILSTLMVSRITYPKVQDKRIITILAVTMIATILAYTLKEETLKIVAGVLLTMLLAYTTTPTIKITRKEKETKNV